MPKAQPNTTRHQPRPAPYPTATPTPTTPYEPRTPPSEERQTNAAWSSKSDELLQQLRQSSHNWGSIASNYFPDKTPNACRKRFERLMEKKSQADSWDNAKMEALGKAYLEVREEMWKLLANRISEKWQNVELKCMESGLNMIQRVGKNAGRRERASSGYIPEFESSDLLHRGPIQRSRSHSDDNRSENFHDLTRSPNTVSRSGNEDERYAPYSAHTEHSSRFPTPTRTFSNSTSSFPSLTPTMTAPSVFTALNTSPTIPSQPPLANLSAGRESSTKLPSFGTHFANMPNVMPSTLASSLNRHHSPANISGGIQIPVTTH